MYIHIQVVHLAYVSIMVGEWMPCGSNFVVQLNDRFGSLELVA